MTTAPTPIQLLTAAQDAQATALLTKAQNDAVRASDTLADQVAVTNATSALLILEAQQHKDATTAAVNAASPTT